MNIDENEIMLIYYQYIKYIDEHLNTIYLEDNMDYTSLLIKYDIPKNNQSINIKEHIMRSLEQLHHKNGNLDVSLLRLIVKQLKLEHGINRKKNELHISILENLCAHFSGLIKFENDPRVLQEIFEYGIDLYNVCNESYGDNDYDIERMISAGKYMKNRGYCFNIVNGRIQFDNKIDLKIHLDIEAIIRNISGFETAKLIFVRELNKIYNQKYERYAISRKKYTLPVDIMPTLPYNYLLQICMKYLFNPCIFIKTLSHEEREQKYLELKKLSENYLTCLGLQNSSIYENLLIDFETLPHTLVKNMLYDKLVLVNQWKPKYIIELIESMFSEIYDNYRSWGYNLKEYLKVVKLILFNYSPCAIIQFDDVLGKINIKRKVLDEIFLDISHSTENVNKDFNCILGKTNFSNKPLIKIKEDEYFLLSPIICGFSFYEVLYNKCKSVNKNLLDRKQGYIFEKLIKMRLDKRNLPYKYGFYKFDSLGSGNKTNECDLIIENDKKIVFIEIKKRPLSRTFEQADDIELLRSLGEGIVYSQRQALEHSIQLENKGNIVLFGSADLSEQKDSTVIEYNNRNIIRISLTLHEYGFLAYKTITEKFMQSLINCTYHTNDTQKEGRLQKLKNQQDKFRELITQIKKANEKPVELRSVFFHTVFRTLQQFLYSLDNCQNIQQLIDNITCDMLVYTGGMDFYSQLFYQLDNL